MEQYSCPGGVSSSKTAYYIQYGNNLLKLDSDDESFLMGAKFQYTSMDEKVSYSFRQEEDFSSYYVPSQNKKVLESDALKWLPKKIQDIYQSIQSEEDLSYYFPKVEVRGQKSSFIDFGYNDCVNSSNSMYTENLSIMIPIKLKEERSPIGYQKQDMVSFARATLLFNFNSNNQLISKNIAIEFHPDMPLFPYDSSVSYMDYVTGYSTIADYLYDNYPLSSTGCDVLKEEKAVSENMDSSSQGLCIGTPVVWDEVGDVSLSIDNTIEEKHDVTISKNRSTSTKVLLKNQGNASTGDTIIQTEIPKDVSVDSHTISDDGVYNKQDHTITWNLEYLDPYSEKEFTFHIVGDKEGDYTFLSHVEDDQVEGIVSSPSLYLHVVDNPKTSGFSIFFFLILFISLIVSFTHKKLFH